MKSALIISFTMLGLGLAFAEESAPLLMPSSRQTAEVSDSERNPFAKVEEPKQDKPTIEVDAKSEESRIEAVLTGLKVVGRTRGASGWKVLLGDLILEAGKPLPPVIEGQTQTLRVAAIYDSIVEIEWVNQDSRELTKRIFIAIQLKPSVGSALGGRQASTSGKASPIVITRPQDDPILPPNAIERE